MAQQTRQQITSYETQDKIWELIDKILVYKFPQQSRQELDRMFTLVDLKKTRCRGAHASHLLNLTLGIGATLAVASPSFAQSTIIYQRTTTYDNYAYPHVTSYPVSPIGGRSLFPPKTNLFDQNPTNSLFPNNPSNNILFPKVRVYNRRPHIRQYVNDSTLVNPVLINPNIRNSTIINPTIINNPNYRRQPRKGSTFIYRFP